MLLELLQTLRNAHLEVTPIEVAEALLLARFFPSSSPAVDTPVADVSPPPAETESTPAPALKPEAAPTTDTQTLEPEPSSLQPGDAVLPQPSTQETGSVTAVPFRSPQARALPAAHKIGAALRPLRRRHSSTQRVVMNEEATVQQIADGGPKTIVWQPARERWLSVELVLDESISMHIWRPTLREFRTLLERHGAFRNLRVWQLNTDDKQAQLSRLIGHEQRAARPQQLLAPMGRQLVIVVSDCTAQAWYHGSAYQMLTQWARQTPTVLTQVLPRSLWLGTSMTEADATMRADQPGLPNAKLRVEPDFYAEWLKTGAPLPIVTLDEWSIAPWAKMVAGSGQSVASGLVLPDLTEALAQNAPLPPPTRPAPTDAAARVASFLETASPLARQLARCLAVAPLSLPVLQLVQQAMLPQSRQSHLAEIFRSDLMNLPAPTSPLTEETIFDFHEGVREELLRDLKRRDTLLVLDKVADFIFERSGQARGFGALMAVPGGKDAPPNAIQVDPLALSFARIGARTLRKLRLRTEQAEQWEQFVQRYDPNARVSKVTLDVSIEPEETNPPPSFTPETIKPGTFPDDPWKGVLGGRSEANHRQLLAAVTAKSGTNLFRIKLTVRTTNRQHPLRGTVTFFLHPGFGDRRTVTVNKKGTAELTIEGRRAFTVGVWADDGATLLELDLAEQPDCPYEFRYPLTEHLKRGNLGDIIGHSPQMQAVYQMVETVAANASTVLIVGESGTGKELVARAIHSLSPRRNRAFVSVNCGAFTETLLEGALFGYVKGAFAGAQSNRKGLFEEAEGGTIFLDEIGEMSLMMQAKLLRVLQERRIRRVGGTEEIPIDTRIVAATHHDLEKMVKSGDFREDLYYRVSVIPLELPPLRERRADIRDLTQHFLDKFAHLTGQSPKRCTEEVLRYLEEYDWPGNVRELENEVYRIVAIRNSGEIITGRDLSSQIKLQAHISKSKKGKIRIYELARELKLESHTIIDAAQRLGIDVKVPSNKLDDEAADKIKKILKEKYYPWPEQTIPSLPEPRLIKQTKPLGADVKQLMFSFTTVTLDRHGQEIKRETRQARQFSDELASGISLELVEISGGTFLRGSPKTEKDRLDREGPQHKVTVSPFYMGKFTITQEQWRAIAADTSLKVKIDLNPEPARFKDKPDSARRPVEQVRWEDATEFCARLAKKTGRAYRLPTEAEWEYACRAGTTTPFAFGETITPELVNYDGGYPYADVPKGEYRGETIPVGSLGVANAFGLFDMHGNVWEWCQDWYGEYTSEEQADPTGPPTGESRLLHGGSWLDYGRFCRSAYRSYDVALYISVYVGFRVVVAARTS